MEKTSPSQAGTPVRSQTEIPLEAIQAAVRDVRFGVVQLIIQDGRVVQIDRTEKIRLV